MGVGLPFALGAKLAKPDKQVVCVHGDGSFGLNAMELDTAVRHKLPVLVVISLNGGWTADPKRDKPGRDLGYTRYDKMAEALGCYGEYVDKAEDIRPALERAQKEGRQGQGGGRQRAHRLPRPRRHDAVRAVFDLGHKRQVQAFPHNGEQRGRCSGISVSAA